MNRRKASDAGGSVLSFTFLDVLMCTMGSLLLLLVLFGVIVKKSTRARREGENVTISLAALNAPDAPAQAASPPARPADEVAAVEEMSQQLAKLRSEQAEIERIRGEAAQRRLEHELAQLHITLEVLQATEQKQTVDQEQAETEVARLKELISETERRLDAMRKAGTGQKSYAIVPYKGANGTFRRPVFVECTADAVTIQPEGIRLTVEDFDGPLRSGNPLAAAIRAAHEELNGRAAAAGRTDLPDPYPLLIVRPDGAAAYAAAIDAIRSWDSDYGYEFVEADWKLKYPELDPRLAQVMAHAVDEARQRQALLAKVAPRQYGSRLGGAGGGSVGGEGTGEGDGFGELTSSGTGNRIGSHAGDGAFGGGRDARGNSLRTDGAGGRYGMGDGSGDGNFSDEFAGGDATADRALTTGSGGPASGGMGGTGLGDPTAGGGIGGQGSTAVGQGVAGATGEGNARDATEGVNGQYADSVAGQSGQGSSSGANSGAAGAESSANGQAGGSAEAAAGGGGASGGTSSAVSASSGGGGGSMSGPSGNAGGKGGVPSVQVGPKSGSIADKRGANWANAEAARRTSAITRPVRVVVRSEQLAVIPEGGTEADATIVSFKQPVDRVVDQLAGAVQMQVVDWGLAGDAMYWRPTLVVTVAPGAQRQAERLAQLLDNSGLDVRLPQSTASASQTERQ
jgi:TolA-binding protein